MADVSSRSDVQGFRAGWSRILSMDQAKLCDVSPLFAARLAQQIGAALAASILQDDGTLYPLADVKAATIWSRLRLAAQRNCLDLLERQGFGGVVLKGYANAHEYYSQPALRVGGDLDLLVSRDSLPVLLQLLSTADYRLQPLKSPRGGLTSDVSFWPLLSPDGHCALDIHLEADAWPWPLAVPADEVFRQAHRLVNHGPAIRAPSRSHSFLLLASNMAKDKFGPSSTRRLLDALRMLAEGKLEWDDIESLAERSQLQRALRAFLALLQSLGVSEEYLPPRHLRLRGLSNALLRRIASQWLYLDFPPRGLVDSVLRESLLGASPRIVVKRGVRRLHTLFYQADSSPPGWSGAVLPKA